jgi:N-acetylmuramate 1-kinase
MLHGFPAIVGSMIDRGPARQALLQSADWGVASAAFLAGDASDRTYYRLTRGAETAVLMDAPPGKGDDPATFLAVAAHLNAVGPSAPPLVAQNLAQGFLLLEDFGDAVYARVLGAAPDREAELYAVAIDALVQLQAAPPMSALPALSPQEWADAAALIFRHYAAAGTDESHVDRAFVDCLATLIAAVDNRKPVMILRDFHAENLIWLPQRKGAARAGLLDFQLAQMGHSVYDVISLLQDARRDVRPETVLMMQRRFRDAVGMTEADFSMATAVWGAQRALRILGVFARLAQHAGKTGYLRLMPRVWGHLQASLAHPALAALQQICAPLLPPPTPEVLHMVAQHGKG